MAAVIVAACGCGSGRDMVKAPVAVPDDAPIAGGTPVSASELPRAIIYKTSGDYRDNVAIQLDAGGNVVSYPAPGDLRGSAPIEVADGFLLDRRGISRNTAFTTYKRAEYMSLPAAPTPSQLKAAVIPGAHVTALYTLPMTTSEAVADTAAVNRYINKILH